jgi:hypothetical protein
MIENDEFGGAGLTSRARAQPETLESDKVVVLPHMGRRRSKAESHGREGHHQHRDLPRHAPPDRVHPAMF